MNGEQHGPFGLVWLRLPAARGWLHTTCLEYLFRRVIPRDKACLSFLGGKFHFCCQLVLLENSFSQHQHVGRPALSSVDELKVGKK